MEGAKHIETNNYFLRDQVIRGRIKLMFCRLEDQLADIMTKPLKIEKFREMRTFISVDPLPEKLNI